MFYIKSDDSSIENDNSSLENDDSVIENGLRIRQQQQQRRIGPQAVEVAPMCTGLVIGLTKGCLHVRTHG